MFSKHTWVLAITNSKIAVARVNQRSKKIDKSMLHTWTPGDLNSTFQKIVKEIKAENIKILIAEDLTFYTGVILSNEFDKETEYEFLKTQLEKRHKTILTDDLWDYFEVEDDGEKRKIVLFAPQKELLLDLNNFLESSDVLVDYIEPESVAKTRHENPIIGLALKAERERSGDTAKIQFKNKNEKNEKAPGKKQNLIKFFKLSSTIILAIAIVASAYYYFQIRLDVPQREETAMDTGLSELSEITVDSSVSAGLVDEEPTERADIKDVTISILNGSGVAGEAASVESLLMDQGFEATQVGNADNQDYETTIVIYKNDLPKTIRDKIEQTLTDEYELEIKPVEQSDQSTDFVIIIGKRTSD